MKQAKIIKEFEESCKFAPEYYTPTSKTKVNTIASEHTTDISTTRPRSNAVGPDSPAAKIAAKMRKEKLATSIAKTNNKPIPGKPPENKGTGRGL